MFVVEGIDRWVVDDRSFVGDIHIGGIVRAAVFDKLCMDVVGIGFADEEAGGVALVDRRQAVELCQVECLGDAREWKACERALAGFREVVCGFLIDRCRYVARNTKWW